MTKEEIQKSVSEIEALGLTVIGELIQPDGSYDEDVYASLSMRLFTLTEELRKITPTK